MHFKQSLRIWFWCFSYGLKYNQWCGRCSLVERILNDLLLLVLWASYWHLKRMFFYPTFFCLRTSQALSVLLLALASMSIVCLFVYLFVCFFVYCFFNLCYFHLIISFATGIEFREGSLLIDSKHSQIIKKGEFWNKYFVSRKSVFSFLAWNKS